MCIHPPLATPPPATFTMEGDTLIRYRGTQSHLLLPQGIRRIGRYAFRDHQQLRRVTLPEGLAEIGEGAFQDCMGLETIDLPGIEQIGAYAFAECNNLCALLVPRTVRSIADRAFVDCRQLEEITLPPRTDFGIHPFLRTGLQRILYPETKEYFRSSGQSAALTNALRADFPKDGPSIHFSDGSIDVASHLTILHTTP